LNQNIFNGTLKIGLFIDIAWMFKNLKTSIGLINSDNLVIIKFWNSKFDLKANVQKPKLSLKSNLELRNLKISKFSLLNKALAQLRFLNMSH